MAKSIFVTEHDLKRLRMLVEAERELGGEREQYMSCLESELDRAQVVEPHDIPRDVVTMNSKVRLRDSATGSEMICTLTFPAEADPERYKISVLAPMGTALLGYGVGNEFEWQAPRGKRRMRVEEIVYQPEAAGNFVL